MLPAFPRLSSLAAALACLVAIGLAQPSRLFAQAPTLTSLTPGAVAPGKATEVLLTGQMLTDPLAVWTSFPAQVELLPAEAAGRKVKFTLADTVAVGLGGIVVATPAGIVGPLFVLVDDLPSVSESGTNNTLATPQELTLPIAVDGTSSGPQFDYFRVTLAQAERVSIEVVGTRLGSDFDSVLRVLDATGRELAAADDDESLGADARLSFAAPTAGQYTIELRDNRYKAGGRYRLRIGNFPLINTAFPAGGASGSLLSTSLITVDGGLLPTSVQLPTSPFKTSFFASAKPAENAANGFAVLSTGGGPEFVATATVENVEQGTPLTLPATINGRLMQPKQRDRYLFNVNKGDRWNFTAISRSVASPAILAMRVLNAAGGAVVATTATESEEELLVFTAPDAGAYRLEVEDLLGRGGPSYVYRVEATAGPFFNLVAKNDPATRFQQLLAPGGGGVFVFDVQVQRNGYEGPIELATVSPRAGFTVFPATIGEKVNEQRAYVYPPPDFHAGELSDVRLLGKANVGPREHVALPKNSVQLKTARPLQTYSPSWLEGAVFVGYADQAPFFTLAPALPEITLPTGGQVMVPFAFERTDANFKDVPLTLVVSPLPADVSVEIKRNGAGPKESYEVSFKAGPFAAEGKHAVHWRGFAEFQGRGRMVEGDLQVIIAKPADQ